MNRKKINRMRFSRLLAVAVLVLAAAVLAAAPAQQPQRSRSSSSARAASAGSSSTRTGRTLYMSTHDRRSKSTCYGKCARAWPPLVTRGKPRAAMGARSALLGTSMRRDGRRQVTYHGHPLYYFDRGQEGGPDAGAGLTPSAGAGTRSRQPGSL